MIGRYNRFVELETQNFKVKNLDYTRSSGAKTFEPLIEAQFEAQMFLAKKIDEEYDFLVT